MECSFSAGIKPIPEFQRNFIYFRVCWRLLCRSNDQMIFIGLQQRKKKQRFNVLCTIIWINQMESVTWLFLAHHKFILRPKKTMKKRKYRRYGYGSKPIGNANDRWSFDCSWMTMCRTSSSLKLYKHTMLRAARSLLPMNECECGVDCAASNVIVIIIHSYVE